MSEDRIKIGELSPGDVAILKNVAEEAAEKACKKTFIAVGINPDDPIKAQEDFSVMRYVGEKVRDPEFKEDLAWVRRARQRSDGIIGKVVLTAVGLGVVGAIETLWRGIKTAIGSGAP